MVTKKNLVIAVLATFCLTATLFMIIPTRSSPGSGDYDPWSDINDDGSIDMADISLLIDQFMTTGDPINKTALLLELISRVDSLNASLLDLEAYFETRMTDLETRIAALEAPGSVTTEKIADYAVNNTKFAAEAIPCNFTSLDGFDEYYSYNGMIRGMSVDITLPRTAHLLILFSANIESLNGFSRVYAAVDGINVQPGYADIYTDFITAHSFNFYKKSVSAGTHTVTMRVLSAPYCVVTYRCLVVIALPA